MMKKILSSYVILGMLIPNVVNALDVPVFFGDDEFPVDQNTLVLDSNNTTGDITLQFGRTLDETLTWNDTDSVFSFSDDVQITGNLDVDGTLATLPAPASEPIDTEFANSQWSLWLDEINDEINLKARKSDGNFIEQVVGSGSGSMETGSMPAVQARRTNDFYFPSTSTYYDIDFDTTDVESNPDVLEHDTTDTDNLLIKQDGLYLIFYHITDYSTYNHTLEVRVRVNNNETLGGSDFGTHDYAYEYVPTDNVFMAYLNAGDFVTLQGRRTTSRNYLINQTKFGMVSLEGVRGADGADGDMPAHEWNGTLLRFENPDGSWGDWVDVGDSSGTPVFTPQMAQYSHSAGNQSINNSNPVAIYWNTEYREDAPFTHDHYSQSSRVYLNETGWYRGTYSISTSISGDRDYSELNCYLRENGSTKIIPSDSYSYVYSRYGANTETNNASFIFENDTVNNYVEVVCSQNITNSNAITVGNAVWITLEKL